MPPRMYRKGGAYYHVVGKKWTPLGSDLGRARETWARLENAAGTDTVSAMIDRYLTSKHLEGKAENTKRSYRRMAEILRRVFGNCHPDEVEPKHIAGYLDEHRHPLVANNEIGLLSVIYEKGLRWGLAKKNPCLGVRRNPVPRRKRYLTDDEYGAIWQAAKARLRLAMDLALCTGLRVGDVCRVRFADIRDGVLSIVQQKTGQPIAFVVEGDLAEVLERARAELKPVLRPTVLCTRSGRPCDPENISRQFSATAARIGVPDVRFHDIRAKCASEEPDRAKDRLGHKDERTTGWYVRKPKPAIRPFQRPRIVEGS